MAKALRKLDINWRNGSGAHRLLLNKAESLASTERDDAFDLEEANEATEELEALLYFRTQFSPYARKGMDDFFQLAPTMASVIIRLKDRVFRYRALPQLRELAKGGPKICQYCNWAIERIDHGRDSLLSDPGISTHPRGCFAYSHLCAVESSQTLPLLEQRAQDGCVLCSYLREHFLISLQVTDAGADGEGDALVDIYKPFYVWLLFDWDDKSMQDTQIGNILRFFTLYVVREGSSSRTARQVRFPVGSNDSQLSTSLGLLSPPRLAPLDPVNLKLIHNCLSAGGHNNTNTQFIPRRLLYLGPTDEFLPRVIDTVPSHEPHEGQVVEYVALSYCWGPPIDACQQLILTAESKQSLYKGISINDLTPVVRDAVTTCRALGFRFLWVDALCILQDDTKDWEENSYDMEKVFACSALTVCAMATSSCLDSFLERTHARLDLPLGSMETITLFPCCSDQEMPFHGGYRQRNTESPLQIDLMISSWSRRGWVFQERMLAPRRVYFGADMIHIHVDNTVTSENGYVFVDEFDEQSIRCQTRYSIKRDSILSHSDVFPDMWYSIIEDFAMLHWSNDLDNLPGLSGIARVFKDVYQDEYVAGLWTKDIACGLLWETRNNTNGFKNFHSSLLSNKHTIGPSWSWVTHQQGFLRFHLTLSTNRRCRVRSHLRPEILDVRAESHVNGENPFGRIHSAALHISGILLGIPGEWELAELSTFWYTTPEGRTICVQPDWNVAPVEENDDRRKLRLLLLSSCCSESPSWVIGEDGLEPRVSVTYRRDYRHTFYQDRNRGDDGPGRCILCGPGHERDAWGLLIYPAAQAGTYYRVGTFLCRAQLGGLSIFDHGYTATITLV